MARIPFVSAIIIFFNAERFLSEALDSVFAQSFDDWELLLVDDGSTDASSRIAHRYAQRHPQRVQCLSHPGCTNHGMAASRNLGWRAARAPHVAFLDADDIWLPRKLEQQVAMLSAHPEAALIYGRTRMWYGWTGRPEDGARDYLRELGIWPNRLVPGIELFRHWTRTDLMPSTSNMLVRRQALESLNGYDERFRDVYSDLPFYLKAFLDSAVAVSSECWDWYRQHDRNSVRLAIESGDWHPNRPNQARTRVLEWAQEHVSASIHDAALRSTLLRDLEQQRLAIEMPTPGLHPTATIRWQSNHTGQVEVRVDHAAGPLLARGVGSGQATTGAWVRDGMRFCLVDASSLGHD